MQPLRFIHALQLTDSLFPVGAFAYSDGLETAVSAGLVADAAALGQWMDHWLNSVFVSCEGLALVKSMRALRANDGDSLSAVDDELYAIRPSGAMRAASTANGKRLLSLYKTLYGDAPFSEYVRNLPYGNAACAYGVVFFHCGLAEQEAALAFGYNRVASMVSAGLRLISIGHQHGQVLLARCVDRLPAAAAEIIDRVQEPLRSFSPLLDIQQMNHQYVYSRLFRS
jgi:urease accessory protein